MTSSATSRRTKVLSAAATFAEDHALRFAPLFEDAWEQFPSRFATALEKVKAVIEATIVRTRVAPMSGDLQLA